MMSTFIVQNEPESKVSGTRPDSSVHCDWRYSVTNGVANAPAHYLLRLRRGCPRGQSDLPFQAKLDIGQPNDKHVQEAHRVADQVMRMPDPPNSAKTRLTVCRWSHVRGRRRHYSGQTACCADNSFNPAAVN